jgi:spermidine/putrescine transport system substrate-binding protein
MPRDMNRRRFISRSSSLALAGYLLAACGSDDEDSAGDSAEQRRRAEQVSHPDDGFKRLVISNWPLYIDKEEIPRFEKAAGGVEVRYIEEINDNQEFFGKVRQPLERGDGIGRDLAVITDWMAARWIRLDYVEPIDKKNVPNAKNLRADLRNPNFDRGRRFTMPWQSGMTSIGFNRKEVGEVTSLKQMFDPKWKGKVSMFTDARDSTSIALLMEGIKPADANIDQILEAVERIDEQNRNGQIRRFTGNDYTTDLTKGNVVMAMAYSGDMIQLKADNPDLDFVIPEEGAVLWSDNMVIPQKPRTAYGAEQFMNYVYDPEVAARIAAYVNYVTPVDGTKEVLAAEDPETAENPLIFPDEATLGRLSGYPNLTIEEEQQMNEAFEAVVGG